MVRRQSINIKEYCTASWTVTLLLALWVCLLPLHAFSIYFTIFPENSVTCSQETEKDIPYISENNRISLDNKLINKNTVPDGNPYWKPPKSTTYNNNNK